MDNFTKIFISHATPEDNYFVKWLTIKLRLLRFDVWAEIDELKGGEDFWKNIEKVVRHETIKVISVLSNSSLSEGKRGFAQELALADKIRDRGDFIIPVRITEVPYDKLPIEVTRLNVIDFSRNWAKGLQTLIEKLELDNIPRSGNSVQTEQINGFWQRGLNLQDTLIKRDELYWTNWFEITLPQHIYIHKLRNLTNTSSALSEFPTKQIEKYVVTFANTKDLNSNVESVHKVKLSDFIDNEKPFFYSSRLKYKFHKPNHIIVEILNELFENNLLNCGLKPYEQSTKTVYFFPESDTKVSLDHYRRGYVYLTGKKDIYRWHFAISGSAFLYPMPAYAVSTHIVFSLNDQVVTDKSVQHKLRRNLGKNWWNKEWRDHLLGTFVVLASERNPNIIKIAAGAGQFVNINMSPFYLMSNKGYLEPGEDYGSKTD